MTTLYRYYDMERGNKVVIDLECFKVIKETPCGWWYVPSWVPSWAHEEQQTYKRWVSKEARVRRCYPTKDEAWRSYCLRKYHQQGHVLRAQARMDAILTLIKALPNHTAPEGLKRLEGNLNTGSILEADL